MNMINTKIENYTLHFAEEKDMPILLGLIEELASYEKMLDQVEATPEILRESIIENKAAQVLIGEYNNIPVSYALFFYNFSTFIGRPGLYLEDLYVKPEVRGKGLGKANLAYLAKLAVESGCARFEWCCLDWNEPSVRFYKQLGAQPLEDWTIFRLKGEALHKLAQQG